MDTHSPYLLHDVMSIQMYTEHGTQRLDAVQFYVQHTSRDNKQDAHVSSGERQTTMVNNEKRERAHNSQDTSRQMHASNR